MRGGLGLALLVMLIFTVARFWVWIALGAAIIVCARRAMEDGWVVGSAP